MQKKLAREGSLTKKLKYKSINQRPVYETPVKYNILKICKEGRSYIKYS